jgi:hypothetical protein
LTHVTRAPCVSLKEIFLMANLTPEGHLRNRCEFWKPRGTERGAVVCYRQADNKKLTITGQSQPCVYRPGTSRRDVIMAIELLSYNQLGERLNCSGGPSEWSGDCVYPARKQTMAKRWCPST